MATTTFDTNPVFLHSLLKSCDDGRLQLPDFQRGWVWEEARILGLISSVSRGFPMGALMSLKSRIESGTALGYRAIEGAPVVVQTRPEQLLLDGQQRMTSLYQSCMRQEVVTTKSIDNQCVKRWFYIDMVKALESEADRDAAVFAIPEDRKLKENFDKTVKLDLSSPDFEYENMIFPLNRVFSPDDWMMGFWAYWQADKVEQVGKMDFFLRFKQAVLTNFCEYQVPVIAMAADTSLEAVCVVFEKVNTGGKVLDAFELVTAMYAAQGYKLREDWLGSEGSRDVAGKPGLRQHLRTFGRAADQEFGLLDKVAATVFLQAIALLHTKELRLAAKANPLKRESEWPAVRASRQSLLDLLLASRTNKIIGGVALSLYLQKLENGKVDGEGKVIEPAINKAILSRYLNTHCIPVAELYADDFNGFMNARQALLLGLVASVTGNVSPITSRSLDADLPRVSLGSLPVRELTGVE